MAGLRRLCVADYGAEVRAGGQPADVLLLKQYVADQIKAAGERKYSWTISTGVVDRDRDTLKVEGWRLDAYRKNPVVLWAHSHRDLPLGKAEWVAAEASALKARMEFAPAEANPMAEMVRALVDFGALRATSVRFRPLKSNWNDERGGMDFEEHELLEFSIVPVPANPEALLDAKAAGIAVAPLRKWAESVLDAAEPGMWVPRDEALKAFKALAEPRVVVPAAYDPEPVVAAVGVALQKRGRVLSAENETRVRAARDAGEAVRVALDEVLAGLTPDEPAPAKAEGSRLAVRLVEPPGMPVDRKDVAAAVAAAVEEAASAAVRRAMGRLD